MKRLFLPLMMLFMGLSFISTSALQAQNMADKTVVEIAAGNDDFSTLVAAVKAAGLAETLSGAGPFTVFAPTNQAFANLPDGLVNALLKPENKAVLQQILTYHVVANKLMASDVVQGIQTGKGNLKATTVESGVFQVMQSNGKVMIKDAQGNTATVTATDIAGSNGVIHVIDRVLLPKGVNPAALLAVKKMDMNRPSSSAGAATKSMADERSMRKSSITGVASGNENFATLTAALKAAGLVETFSNPGEYTVFAPTDAAFDQLPAGTVNTLVTREQAQLKGILAYHVVPAKITAAQLMSAIKANNNYYVINTLGNQTLVATIQGGSVQLIDGNGNRSTVVMTDVAASNGIIHAIDTVIMPRSK